MPALLTRMSIGPCCATVSAIARSIDSWRVTSSSRTTTGSFSSRATASSGPALARLRMVATTWWPWRAKWSAVARPMPVLVPVTRVTGMTWAPPVAPCCARRSPSSRARSPSKQVLPKREGLPQNRCYQSSHRKGGPVTERGRREYAAVIRARYGQADKRERGRLLTEYCRTTGCHRKAAIRRLRRAPRPPGRAPGRPARYVAREVVPILEPAWLASDTLSAKLLRPILPAIRTALATHHGLRLPPAAQAALTAASAATLDRLLRPLRRRRPRQPRRLAPALAPLRAQVPLRTWSEWTGVRPGAVQGDLVWHCGESLPGR